MAASDTETFSNTGTLLAASPELAALCRDNGIKALSLFGSQLHGSAHAGSDIDLLVQFLPGQRVTLLDMVRLEEALTEMLGCKADLHTAKELSPYFQQTVIAEARLLYSGEKQCA